MTDPVRVNCPHCQVAIRLRSRDYLDRELTCPGCRQKFRPHRDQALDVLDVVEDEPIDSRPPVATVRPSPKSDTSPPPSGTSRQSPQPGSAKVRHLKTSASPLALEEDDFLDEDVAGDSEQTASVSRRIKKPRSSPAFPWKNVARWAGGTVLTAGLLAGLWGFFFVWNGDIDIPFAGGGTTASAEALTRVRDQLKELEQLLVQQQARGFPPEALIPLQQQEQRFLHEYQQALALPPLPTPLASQLRQESRELLIEIEQRRQACVALLSGAGAHNPRFSAPATTISLATDGVVRVVAQGPGTVETSASPGSPVWVRFVALQRDVLQALAAVESSVDLTRAAATLNQKTAELQQLIRQYRELTDEGRSGFQELRQRQQGLTSFYDNEMLMCDRMLMIRGIQQQDYQHAFVSYRNALRDLEGAGVGGTVNGGGELVGGGPVLPVPGGFPGRPRGFPDRPTLIPDPPRLPGGGPPGPPGAGPPGEFPPGAFPPGVFPPGGFPRGVPGMGPPAPGAGPGFQVPQSLEDFVQKIARDMGGKYIVVHVPGMALSSEQQQELSSRMQQVVGPIRSSQSFSGSNIQGTLFGYAIADDPQKVADKIAFAKVLAVDAQKRLITLEIKPGELDPAEGFPRNPPGDE